MTALPRPEDILEWIQNNPDLTGSKDIARAFDVKGREKTALKSMLREMKRKGEIKRNERTPELREGTYHVARVTDRDPDGTAFARPLKHPEEMIRITADNVRLDIGDQVLISLEKPEAGNPIWGGRLVRRIDKKPQTVIARFEDNRHGGAATEIDKGRTKSWKIISTRGFSPETGDIIEIEPSGQKGKAGREAKIIRVLGHENSPRILSQLSIENYDLPTDFPEHVIKEAETHQPPEVVRRDLTHLAFTTIDPATARDHDDAVYGEKSGDGWKLYVAIADVAAYVLPGSALDHEARLRGNSVYFPDQVVPMLPEALSADVCSLHEGVDRAVLVAEMDINARGHKTGHRFYRAVIRSRASLAYETAQAIEDGEGAPPQDVTMEVAGAVSDLFEIYRLLARATRERQPLHLDLPERSIDLSGDNQVVHIGYRERLDAHKLIEEMMVLANVAAAEAIEDKHGNLLYRVHDEPKPEKIDTLKTIAKAAELPFSTKGKSLDTKTINTLLDGATGHNDAELINHSVLRTLTQAYYGPEQGGHFGLNLKRYAHFTSPIRRYADIIVHRALISAYNLGDDGLSETDIATLAETGKSISQAERRAMQAERETEDRYMARYLETHKKAEFAGRIAGLAKFGLFVRLDDIGADGFVPLAAIGDDHYRYDKNRDLFRGQRTGRVIKLGQRVRVKLREVNPLSGGIELEMLEIAGEELDPVPDHRPRRGRPTPRARVTKKAAGKTANRTKSRRIRR